MYKKRGFTLAEVLLTLGIVGIVAALTIPHLVKNTNNMEFAVAYKKIYSDLQNAQMQIINDDGKITVDNNLTDKLTQYMKFSATCKWPDSPADRNTRGCWYDNSIAQNRCPACFNYAQTYAPNYNSNGGVLQNGMLVSIFPPSGMWVDVNGYKGPNREGEDVLTLSFDTNKGRFVAVDAEAIGALEK